MAVYESMKDSRVGWLGKIPSSWGTILVKHIFSIKKNIAKESGHTVLSVTQRGIIPKNMTDKGQFAKDYSHYQLVSSGEFVMNHMDLLTGWIDISKYDGVTSPDYRVFINEYPEQFISEYYKHVFQYCYFNRIFYGLGQGVAGFGRWRLPADMFLNFALPVPSVSEQSAIAAYLDDQCVKIDTLIEEAKASIEEYKQWKASLIFEAVTKGLDPNVEMKDSGNRWMGHIPNEWHTCKTLYVLSMAITDGPHTTPELFDNGVPFISAEAVSCGNGGIDFSHKRGYISEEFYQECCKKYVPQRNDIYMIKSGATTGRVSMVETDERFTIWSPLAVFRANSAQMFPRYLFYFLQSDAYQKQVELGWTYGTQQNIGMRTLEQLKLCVPPINTQIQIAGYLDSNCSTINSLIDSKTAFIDDLELYKKSLIFETVTGKRKVV